MFKAKSRIIIALVTFLLGVAATTLFLLGDKGILRQPETAAAFQDKQRLRLVLPDARWESFFFESLDEHTKKINLPRLRMVVLPKDDFEVRFWRDALPHIIDGVILRRSGNQWSALHLHGTYERQPFFIEQELLAAPKSGWEAAWERLVSAGILTLPDASEVQCNPGVLDGVSYVVEVNVNKIYRTYRYGNPQFAECNEARRMVLIDEIIADEFGLENPQS